MADRLYFLGGYDCEPLSECSPQCGGPLTWDESERKVLEIADIYRKAGMVAGCQFHLTPEAAKAQPDLYRSLRDEGFYIGVQPNVPGFRFPTYNRDLGLYSAEEQREIIRAAREDFEAAMGFATTTYTTCCGSRSDATMAILVENGYKEYRPPGPGRMEPGRPDKTTVGMFPFPYPASDKHRCLAGCLDLLVLPTTVDQSGKWKRNSWCPADPRGECPVNETTWEMYRDVIDSNIELGLVLDVPLKTIHLGGHNTRFCEAENVAYVVDYCKQAATKYGLELVPISPPELRAEAVRTGWL
jgi:hypothetical protein